MTLNFNHITTEVNTFIKKYANELQLENDNDKAGRISPSILNGLRAIIPPEESLQLLAKLSMLLKTAIY